MMCDQVEALGCPLHVECWTSSLLGRLWELRVNLQPSSDGGDWALVRGGPIVKDIAAHGGRGAKLILSAVQRVDPDGLGVLCGELADRLPGDLLPDWAGQIGSASVVRATSARSPLDEEVMFLEAGGDGHEAHSIAVFIDHRLGGLAKHLGLIQAIEKFDGDVFGSGSSAVVPMPLNPIIACQRLRGAIMRTDASYGPPVGEKFADLRALALSRAHSLL
jgi:hypothetical protein